MWKMPEKEIESYCPESIGDWEQWLEKNHQSKKAVWLVCYRQKSENESISWSDAVDIALCFGWIDSKRQTLDEFSFRQYYTKRKPTSTWSKINKEKVQQLMDSGQMRPAGYEIIKKAKKNGSWTLLDEVEALIIPDDLEIAFATQKGAKEFYLSLSKSHKKQILSWIVLAKRPETRQKRIDEIASRAGQGLKPKHNV